MSSPRPRIGPVTSIFCLLIASSLVPSFAQQIPLNPYPQGLTPGDAWSELLAREPYPFTLPLPPPRTTPVDATYVKFEPKEEPRIPCRRCPDYAPEGGIWKLSLSKGVFRIFHPASGWKDMGSFVVAEDKLVLANDPVCHETFGIYRWRLEDRTFTLEVIEDRCAIGLRAMNLAKFPWLSCQPPNVEAATTDHWPKPRGCD